jgi:ribosome recycling factor
MANAEKPVLSSYKDRMDKSVLSLKEDFAGLRTGRASSSLLDQIMVNAYGSMVALNTVASISVPEPRQINVNIWDKGVVAAVEKAVRNSDLGLNPVVEGNNLRIPIPPLTEERRKDLSKIAGKYAEVQKMTDEAIKRIDEALKTKEQEIMQV